MQREYDFYPRNNPDQIITCSGETFTQALRQAAEILGIDVHQVHYSPRLPEVPYRAPEDPGLTEADKEQWRYEHGYPMNF